MKQDTPAQQQRPSTAITKAEPKQEPTATQEPCSNKVKPKLTHKYNITPNTRQQKSSQH